ncbi:hypothetical protein [Roseomonas sp. WA12]
MPSLSIEGIPNPVSVDASFANLSPEDQARTVDEIKTAWASKQTPEKPVAGIADSLVQGARDTVSGFSNTARIATGDLTVRPEENPSTRSAAGEVIEGVRNWDFGRAASNLPAAIAGAVPDMAGTLAAGAAGAAAGSVVPFVGTAVGGLLGAGLYSAGRNFGDTAENRARNNNRREISGGDLAGAAGTTAATAALDAVGARGAGTAVSSTGRHIAREGATEMLQSGVQQAGETAFTERGLSVDPAQMLGEGVIGAGARGATTGTRAAVQGGAQAIARRGAEAAMGDMDVRQAASVERLNQITEEAREQKVITTDTRPEQILNTVHGALTANVETLLRDGYRAGWIDDDQRTRVREVFESARRHNKTLLDGTISDNPAAEAEGLALLDTLNAPPGYAQGLRDLFVDVNTLSQAGRAKNLTGPAEKIGDFVGRAGSVALAAGTAGPGAAVGGLALALGGNPLGARIGASVGRGIDTALGSRAPAVLLARQKAQKILAAAGVEAGSTRDTVSQVRSLLDDPTLRVRASMGVSTDPVDVSREVAKSVWKRLQAGLEVNPDQIGLLTEEDRQKLTERLAFEDEKAAKKSQDAAARQAERARAAEDRKAAAEAARAAVKDEKALEDAAKADEKARQQQIEAAYAQRNAPDEYEAAQAQLEAEKEAQLAAMARQGSPEPEADPNLDAVTRSQVGEWQALLARQRRLEAAQGVSATPAPPKASTASQAAQDGVAGAIAKAVRTVRRRSVKQPVAATPEAPPQQDELPFRQPATGGTPAGWQYGIMKHIADTYQRGVSADEVDAAVQRMVDEGRIDEDVAATLPGRRHIGELQKAITQEVLASRGVDQRNPFAHLEGEADGPNGGDRPVRNVHQYRSAADSYQAAVERATRTAEQAGDWELHEMAGVFGTATETDLPGAVRVFRAKALTEASPDPVTKARRKAALEPLLTRYRKKD